MAPLVAALATRFKEKRGDVIVYEGHVDPEWTIGAVPHGGYALGLILEAAIQSQSNTTQPDVCHCTAHFLRSALVKPFEVHLKLLKIGRGFTNLTAELHQDGGVRILTHLIFTALPDAPGPQLPSPQSITVTRPSPMARQIPLEVYSGSAQPTKLFSKFNFRNRVRWSEQWDQINRRNEERRADGRGGAEWAAWMQLTDEKDSITPSTLAFFADMMRNLPELMPADQKPEPSWFPTMVLAIDFKVKLASLKMHRTVGLWSAGSFMINGRHDNSVEVWTAPADLASGPPGADGQDWRREQHCLCVSTQMALTLPRSVNDSRAAKL